MIVHSEHCNVMTTPLVDDIQFDVSLLTKHKH